MSTRDVPAVASFSPRSLSSASRELFTAHRRGAVQRDVNVFFVLHADEGTHWNRKQPQ